MLLIKEPTLNVIYEPVSSATLIVDLNAGRGVYFVDVESLEDRMVDGVMFERSKD